MKKLLLIAFLFSLSGCAATMDYLMEDLGYVSERAQARAEALPEEHVNKPEAEFYASLVAGAGALLVLGDRRWFHRKKQT